MIDSYDLNEAELLEELSKLLSIVENLSKVLLKNLKLYEFFLLMRTDEFSITFNCVLI